MMKQIKKLLTVSLLAFYALIGYSQQSTTGEFRPSNVSVGVRKSDYNKIKRVSTTNIKVLQNVPAYIWRHGCGPTSLGMVMGYYDNLTGNSNFMGINANRQDITVNNLIASQNHYDDYSVPIDSYPDLLKDKSELGGAHASECIADFMETSWSINNSRYGWSWGDRIGLAFEKYVQYRNHKFQTRTDCVLHYDQSWVKFIAEIENNRPVILCVDTDGDNSTDHFVIGIGYDNVDNLYAVFDTWDNTLHWYKWTEMKIGNEWGVSFFHVLKLGFDIIFVTNDQDAGKIEGTDFGCVNEEITLKAIPNPNYTFLHWTEDDRIVSTSAEYTFIATQTRKLTANFSSISYPVTFAQPATGGMLKVFGGGGAEIQSGTEVEHGTQLRVEVALNGNYVLKALTANGADIMATKTVTVTDATEIAAVVENITGITDIAADRHITLSPNPARLSVTIELAAGLQAERIEITDLSGRTVYSAPVTARTMSVKVSGFAKGVYLVRAGNATKKLIVE